MQYSKQPNLDNIINCEQKAVKIILKAHLSIIATVVLMGRDDLISPCTSSWCEQVTPEAA